MKKELIDRILPLEYAMFQQVPNRNGRAACQDDWPTFRIMRSSQFSAWTPEMCRLYLTCLQAAWTQGRNLVQEKYGWMMADTFPEEFTALQSALPPVEPERQRLAREILDIQIPMTARLQQEYPLAARRGRPLYPDPTHPRVASVATYLRGELYTYSLPLLQAYLSFLQLLQARQRSLPREILEYTARQYGYADLNAFERQLRQAQAT